MVQHQRHHHRVQFRVGNRQRLERALTDVHVVVPLQARACRLQHVRRAIHGDDARDIRREGLGHLPGAAAEIADHQAIVEQGQQRGQVHALAEQVRPESIPLPRGR